MESLQSRVESWIRDQRNRIRVSWPQLRWPWKNDREQRKKLQEEYERRRKQLQGLCHAVKADSISDLQDILCAMVLSECVYKRPATEMVRAANKFKADFGGQVVSLERVQPSLDHVPHRYLLAEAGDTLFASFIGTKQYKDVIADANIFQGAVFHEDFIEDIEGNEGIEGDQVLGQNKKRENLGKTLQSKPDQVKNKPKPAAHRGFLARAKGIPALELYRLAQKKNRKLVLCGHSLGGAVAALATLAILRVIASSSPRKENENVQVKCITFSQPPVGNAALRDYVHREGWQHYFKTYCIPEDLVPRILSPAYFHHYNAQLLQTSAGVGILGPSLVKDEEGSEQSRMLKPKENDEEQLVLGLGPVQNSFWRLSRLVPLEGIRKQLDKFRGRRNVPGETSLMADSGLPAALDEVETEPQSLEIQEGSDGISLTPLSDSDNGSCDDTKASNMAGKSGSKNGDSRQWHRVPYLPSYVPFGQLYLVGNSSVESLSDSEYSKLTSVRSVLAELRERFQSHSMKSYRSRFQNTAASAMETSVLRKNSSTFDLSTGNSPKDVLVGDNLPLRNFYETSSSVSTSHLGESGFGVQVQGFADPAKVSSESTLSESEHDSSSLTRLPLQDVRSGDALLMFQESVYSETSSEVQREEFREVKVEFQETFLGHTSPISRCRFSAAGTNIASASADGTVRIWTYDSSTPTSRNATIYCGAEIMSLDWECKSDRLLLIGTADGGIKAWNVDAKRVVCDLSTTASFPSVLDLKCSPVDPIFVSAAASTGHGSSNIDKMGFASLTVWNMKTWKAMTVLPLGKDPPAITSLCFNHNGKILAASATDGMIHMFDMAAGLQITGWPAHDAAVSSVLFGPDETSIFSLGSDGKIFEWSLQNQGQVLWSRDCSRFCYPESTKNCRHEMALDSHGRRLLVTSDSVRSPIYQVQGHMSGLRTLPHSAAITTVDWHPTLPIFLTGSADHSVRVTSIS